MITPGRDTGISVTGCYIHKEDPIIFDCIDIEYIKQHRYESFPLIIEKLDGDIMQYHVYIKYKYNIYDIYGAIRNVVPGYGISYNIRVLHGILKFTGLTIYNVTRDPMVNIVEDLLCLSGKLVQASKCIYFNNARDIYMMSSNLYHCDSMMILNPGDNIQCTTSIDLLVPDDQVKYKLMLLNTNSSYHKKLTSLVCSCIHVILGSTLKIEVVQHNDKTVMVHNILLVSGGVRHSINTNNPKCTVDIFYSSIYELILEAVSKGADITKYILDNIQRIDL